MASRFYATAELPECKINVELQAGTRSWDDGCKIAKLAYCHYITPAASSPDRTTKRATYSYSRVRPITSAADKKLIRLNGSVKGNQSHQVSYRRRYKIRHRPHSE